MRKATIFWLLFVLSAGGLLLAFTASPGFIWLNGFAAGLWCAIAVIEAGDRA